MNYYIIPKNNFSIKLNILYSDKIDPYISHSLIFYLDNINKQISNLQENSINEENITVDYVNKIVNPLEFIHSNVPGSTISVSKVKPDSTIFFELIELFQLTNINELFLKQKINIAHLTHNYASTNYLLNLLREDNDDNSIYKEFNYNDLYKLFTNKYENKLDLIICEFNSNEYKDTRKYINNMILILLIVMKHQNNQGVCIIKINNILFKPIIDIIFIMSSIYNKIYLVKPLISNVMSCDRYLICKGFCKKNEDNKILLDIEKHIYSIDEKYVNSIIDNELPYYFINKLEESNVVIGQQQLEHYGQIINIFKNKNREDKIEILKRTHIQKCINWCEKNQLPYNKFTDKLNIFLYKKEDKIEETY